MEILNIEQGILNVEVFFETETELEIKNVTSSAVEMLLFGINLRVKQNSRIKTSRINKNTHNGNIEY